MKYINILISIVFFAFTTQAQTIQMLPDDPAVKSGVLPNGISYYVASNPSVKGVADFALVQKTGALTVPDTDRNSIVAVSQEALSSQYRLLSPTVQDYFMDLGTIPGRNGFAQVTDNATVFRFENVMIGGDADVVDSTLLVLMGIVEKTAGMEEPVTRGWYSPSDQALIIAGDVDAKQMSEKLKMLSYMVLSEESFARQEYEWVEQDTLQVRGTEDQRDLVTVSARWRLQRTPRELMNTVQPVVYERFMTELGIVAKTRMQKILESAGIPCADISYDFVSGRESLGDESFGMTVSVAPRHVEAGVSVLASVLSDLDASGASLFEVRRARLLYLSALDAEKQVHESNADYIDRCISAFVYNSPLTSRTDIMAFHTSRYLSDEDELDIFNSIVSSSLDGSRNLVLEYKAKDGVISSDRIGRIFSSSWMSEQNKVRLAPNTVPSLYGSGEPVKVKSSKKEYMSGGTVWTLSNGIRVVFRQMPTDDKIYYSLVLNGGYANIPDLHAGEGGYMSDILNVSRIGGTEAERFLDVIRQNGMSMDLEVGFSTTTLRGAVRDDGLEYLMSVLLTVMNDRKTDRDRLGYYAACEQLRQEYAKGSVAERISAIDSILCPGYRYSAVKAAGSLDERSADKADALMESLSGKMNDGILVLAGDIDEKKLKAALQMYAGGFRTEDRTFARPFVSYRPISGTVMRTSEGTANSVDMVLSVPMALTADNYYLAAVASLALRNELTKAVAGTGMWLRLSHNCKKDPHERFNMMISLNEASVEGFVPGTVHEDPVVALTVVREALEDPLSLEISDAELSSYKEMLKKYIAERKKDPEYWLEAVSMRYVEGKDFTTGCDARIDAVTVDKVKGLLASLVNGSRVEYIISRK